MQQAEDWSSRPLEPLEELHRAGYQYVAFISWPRSIQERFARFVQDLALGLEDRFQDEGGAKVFWDSTAPQGSEAWDVEVRGGLCRSALMLAILVPSYFKSERCAIEWAIAHHVVSGRLPQDALAQTCIIPIPLTEERSWFPKEAMDLNPYREFKRAAALGGELRNHPEWIPLLDGLAQQILRIVKLLCQTSAACNWEEDEALTKATTPFPFTWREASPAPPAPPRRLPGLVVEARTS